MKICYLVGFPLADDSGHSGATQEKIEALRRIGCNVSVVSCNEYLYKNCRVADVFALEARAIARIVAFGPDLVISRGPIGYFAALVARKRGITFARENHGNPFDEIPVNVDRWTRMRRTLAASYSRALDFRADALIFNHPVLVEFFREKFSSKKIKTIWSYNGVNPAKVSRLGVGREASLPERESKKPYLLFVGNISRWHGLRYVFEMYVRSEKLQRRFDLVIIGPASEDSLTTPYHGVPGIYMLGKMNNERVQAWISNSFACLLPVDQVRTSPGSPLKLYEYLAHGKAVITQKNVTGYSDEVEKYGAGLSLDFKQPVQAADRIIEFADNGQIDPIAIRRKVLQVGTWDAVVASWLDDLDISPARNFG